MSSSLTCPSPGQTQPVPIPTSPLLLTPSCDTGDRGWFRGPSSTQCVEEGTWGGVGVGIRGFRTLLDFSNGSDSFLSQTKCVHKTTRFFVSPESGRGGFPPRVGYRTHREWISNGKTVTTRISRTGSLRDPRSGFFPSPERLHSYPMPGRNGVSDRSVGEGTRRRPRPPPENFFVYPLNPVLHLIVSLPLSVPSFFCN